MYGAVSKILILQSAKQKASKSQTLIPAALLKRTKLAQKTADQAVRTQKDR